MMQANHLYETITVFLTGVGLGVCLFELRRFYKANHPPTIDRSARQANSTEAKKQTATRSVQTTSNEGGAETGE